MEQSVTRNGAQLEQSSTRAEPSPSLNNSIEFDPNINNPADNFEHTSKNQEADNKEERLYYSISELNYLPQHSRSSRANIQRAHQLPALGEGEQVQRVVRRSLREQDDSRREEIPNEVIYQTRSEIIEYNGHPRGNPNDPNRRSVRRRPRRRRGRAPPSIQNRTTGQLGVDYKGFGRVNFENRGFSESLGSPGPHTTHWNWRTENQEGHRTLQSNSISRGPQHHFHKTADKADHNSTDIYSDLREVPKRGPQIPHAKEIPVENKTEPTKTREPQFLTKNSSPDWKFCLKLYGIFKLAEILLSTLLLISTSWFSGWFNRGGIFVLHIAFIIFLVGVILLIIRVYQIQLPFNWKIELIEIILHPTLDILSLAAVLISCFSATIVWAHSWNIELSISFSAFFSALLTAFFLGDSVVYIIHFIKQSPIE